MAGLNNTSAAVLGHLRQAPLTGWEIAQTVELQLCDFFNVTRSQIYRELRTLTEAGLVRPGEVGARDKRPYTITAEGRRAFRDWLHEDPEADLLRSPFFLKLSFADQLDRATVERYVAEHRRRTEERLAYYLSLQPMLEAELPNSAHVLRAGIAYREAMLEWLDSLPWGRS